MIQEAERGYGWGIFQAWSALAFAIVQFLFVRGFVAPVALGVFFLYLWRGLLRKRRYGYVLFYVATWVAIIAGLFHLAVETTWDVFGQLLIGVCFWGIPAAFYYPKRYREFGFGAKPQPSEPKAEPEPNARAAVAGSAITEKPEGIRMVDYEEWREAVARARVERMNEEKNQK